MHGGFFDLGSATFNMTHLTGQLDAYVDLVAHRTAPESAGRSAAGDGAVCTNFLTTSPPPC
jgi:hypothetical protein